MNTKSSKARMKRANQIKAAKAAKLVNKIIHV